MKNFYLNVELTNKDAKMPTRAHETDAGLDVYATENFIISYGLDVVHNLGFKVEFPKGYCLRIVDKSGRSVNDKLMVGAGVIDSDYRGEVKVHLFNLGFNTIYIKKGEKIAQILVNKIWTGIPNQVDHIKEDTKRGTGGFGSTGLKYKIKKCATGSCKYHNFDYNNFCSRDGGIDHCINEKNRIKINVQM